MEKRCRKREGMGRDESVREFEGGGERGDGKRGLSGLGGFGWWRGGMGKREWEMINGEFILR